MLSPYIITAAFVCMIFFIVFYNYFSPSDHPKTICFCSSLQPFTRCVFSSLREVSILRDLTVNGAQSCHSFQIVRNETRHCRIFGNISNGLWKIRQLFVFSWMVWKRLRERGIEEGIQTSDSRRRFQFQNETSCEEKWFAFLIERYAGAMLYKLGQR